MEGNRRVADRIGEMTDQQFLSKAEQRRAEVNMTDTRQDTTSDWGTLAEIKRANAKVGYWFTEGAMQFFDTEVIDVVYGGNWFVYRNRFTTSDGKATDYWKIAHAMPDGRVNSDAISHSISVGTVSSAYATQEEAEAHARELEAGRILCECVGETNG